MSVNSAYASKMGGYASRAASALSMPKEVIIAQWALESGNGTSNHAKNFNNHAGIKLGKYSKTGYKREGTAFAGYKTLDDFVTDYIRVMNLSYYDDVRSATTIEGTVKALGASPYDAGHYESGGTAGGKLLTLMGLKSTGATNEGKKLCPSCHRPL